MRSQSLLRDTIPCGERFVRLTDQSCRGFPWPWSLRLRRMSQERDAGRRMGQERVSRVSLNVPIQEREAVADDRLASGLPADVGPGEVRGLVEHEEVLRLGRLVVAPSALSSAGVIVKSSVPP